MSDTPTGRFCWYELMTTDPVAAPSFYTDVFGWDTQTWEGGTKPYTMWVNGGQPIGGVILLPDQAVSAGAPSHWLPYLSTPDVAATTHRARELGAGVLMGPTEIPEVGTISVLSDPQGAVFAAYQPATTTPGHDGPPQVGEFSWHELATTDWEAAWAFYSELFEWAVEHDMDMGPLGTYRLYNRGAHPLGGIFNKPEMMPVPMWLLYARVPDVPSAAERVKAAGGQVINGPMEVPGGDLIAHCLDPQGAMFAIHATAEETHMA
ncbi:MAG: VOC family protein [Gemmatimonadota bacterium]